MKKTIAKIMAAAMVLSTVAAPNVLAAVSNISTQPAALTNLTLGSGTEKATLIDSNTLNLASPSGSDKGSSSNPVNVSVTGDGFVKLGNYYQYDTNVVLDAEAPATSAATIDIAVNAANDAAAKDVAIDTKLGLFKAEDTNAATDPDVDSSAVETAKSASTEAEAEAAVKTLEKATYATKKAFFKDKDAVANLKKYDVVDELAAVAYDFLENTSKTVVRNAVKAWLDTAGNSADDLKGDALQETIAPYGASKVVVSNGEFNAETVNAGAFNIVYDDDNSLIIRITDDVAGNAYLDLLDGGEDLDLAINFTANTVLGGNATAWLRLQTTTTTDDNYWNGYVMLEGDNDLFTPIRVHYTTTDKAFTADGNGAYVVVADSNARRVYIDTVSGELLSSRRLTLVAVHPSDLALLKADFAKGKNLQLNEVFQFVGNHDYEANWGTSLWAMNNDSYTSVSLGQVSIINSRLFKDGKEKLVKAENVKQIHNGAFRSNKQLKKAIIGNEKNIKKINSKAFKGCKKLATVRLSGKTLKQVGSKAFDGVKNNVTFRIKGNKTQYNKAVKKIKKQAPKKAKFVRI